MTSETSENALEPRQLSMSVPTSSVVGIPDARVPGGYVLRQYRPGDEDSWQGLLRAGGFSEDWSSRTVHDYMLDPVRRAGSWVAAAGDDLVSATFATPNAQCAETAFFGLRRHTSRPQEQGPEPGGVHGCHEVLPRARLQAHPSAHRRLETARDQPIPVDGLRARNDEGRHAAPVAGGTEEAVRGDVAAQARLTCRRRSSPPSWTAPAPCPTR